LNSNIRKTKAEAVIDAAHKDMRERYPYTLKWDRPMTSEAAGIYHMTRGFVSVELYDAVERELKIVKKG